MKIYKKLAGQTLVYGMGTIIPKVLNYSILTVWYTRLFSVVQFGVLTELYAYVGFLMIILTYGMETGFFRFSRSRNNEGVYSSVLITLFSSSSLFVLIIFLLRKNIAEILDYPGNVEYISMLGIIVAIDAFCTIPFAKLRLQEKSIRFSLIRIVNVLVTIACVLFFYEVLPWMDNNNWNIFHFVVKKDVTYVLLSNLIASFVVLIMLFPEIFRAKIQFSVVLMKEIFIYSLPLLIAGLAGYMNEALDKILLKHLISDPEVGKYELGIYGANFKIAGILFLFVQMLRYALEPFYFNYYKSKDDKEVYATIMRLVIACMLVLSLALMFYLNYVKYFIAPKFHEGLKIVPIVIVAYLFYGIFFNLSIWYKLKKKTIYGAILTISGAVITIFINIIFVRKYSYVASSVGHVVAYFTMMVLSYFLGRKYFPIDYKLGRIAEYLILALFIFIFAFYLLNGLGIFDNIVKAFLLLFYVIYVLVREQLFTLKNVVKWK